MDSQKRLLIALGLCLALTMVYTLVFAPRPAQVPPRGPTVFAPSASDAGPAPVPAFSAKTPAPTGSVPLAPAEIPIVEVERDRSLVHYRLSNRGAGLLKAELQGPKMREQLHLTIGEGFQRLFGGKVAAPPQMDMGRPIPDHPLPLAISIQGSHPLSADAMYEVLPGAAGDGSSVFRTSAGVWVVTKRFEWTETGFDFKYQISIRNISAQVATGELAIEYGRAVDPLAEEKPSYFGGVGNLSSAVCSVGTEGLHRLVPNDKPPPEYSGMVNFAGIDQQYFLAALYPIGGPRSGKCVLNANATGRAVTVFLPIQIQPGETVTENFGVYVGPKDIERLTAVGMETGPAAEEHSPHLEKTVDLGMWAFICKILLWILKFFHGLTANWGVAIIGLTLVVKLILLPLTHKMMVSGEAMKKLQPKVEAIRKKYAEDKEKQNLELMKLYQEAKVNPLGGCLPLLIQMPVWFALFTTLRTTYEIYGEPFVRPLWEDLTYKDPTYLLPAALGVTMIVTQKLQPQVMDAAQARVMTYVMPVFLTAIMMNYPSGLTLYIFTNNVLSIAQQYGLRRYLEKKGVAQPQEKRK